MDRYKNIAEFKKKLSRASVLGLFSKTTDSSLIEVMGYSGADFVIIDMEHGPVSLETLQHHIRAADNSTLCPIVRVATYEGIGKALDVGAAGIQISSVSTVSQVRKIIEKAKFHPNGQRGVCRFVRAANYSTMDRSEYFVHANSTIVIIQIEGVEGIKNLDKIISIEGIDVVFIGPYDLSQSLGFPGQVDNPVVKNEIKKIIKKATEKNIAVGTFCDSEEQVRFYKSIGVNYIAYSVDLAIFSDAVKKICMFKENE